MKRATFAAKTATRALSRGAAARLPARAKLLKRPHTSFVINQFFDGGGEGGQILKVPFTKFSKFSKSEPGADPLSSGLPGPLLSSPHPAARGGATGGAGFARREYGVDA